MQNSTNKLLIENLQQPDE